MWIHSKVWPKQRMFLLLHRWITDDSLCNTFWFIIILQLFFFSLVNQIIDSKHLLSTCVVQDSIYHVRQSSHFIFYSFSFSSSSPPSFFLSPEPLNFPAYICLDFFSLLFFIIRMWKFPIKFIFFPCFVPLGKNYPSTGKVENIHQF